VRQTGYRNRVRGTLTSGVDPRPSERRMDAQNANALTRVSGGAH